MPERNAEAPTPAVVASRDLASVLADFSRIVGLWRGRDRDHPEKPAAPSSIVIVEPRCTALWRRHRGRGRPSERQFKRRATRTSRLALSAVVSPDVLV